MNFKCDTCEKEFQNQKGLAGHMYGVHGRRIGLRADLELAKDNAERALLLAQAHTERLNEMLGIYDQRIKKLEELLSGFYEVYGANLPTGHVFLAKDDASPDTIVLAKLAD